MEQTLEHDPGHVRTRAHYESMLLELRQEQVGQGAITVAEPTAEKQGE